MADHKQLLVEVSVISRIIKIMEGVIGGSPRLRLITFTETLIILDITKTESNDCFLCIKRKKKEKLATTVTDNQRCMISKSNHVKFAHFVFLAVSEEAKT